MEVVADSFKTAYPGGYLTGAVEEGQEADDRRDMIQEFTVPHSGATHANRQVEDIRGELVAVNGVPRKLADISVKLFEGGCGKRAFAQDKDEGALDEGAEAVQFLP